MTLKLSATLRNKILGDGNPTIKMICADTIAFVDSGTTAADTMTDSGEGFVTAGFVAGDTMYIDGTSSNDTDGTGIDVVSVTAGTLTFATATMTNEAAAGGTQVAVASAVGDGLKNTMRNGVIYVFNAAPPSGGPEAAYTGTLLCKYTLSSAAWAAGAEAGGIEFGDAEDGYIEKASSEVWSGTGIVTGTAAGFRFCANATDDYGASTTLPRMDGTCGGSTADLEMATTTITIAKTNTIDEFKLTLPEFYGATA